MPWHRSKHTHQHTQRGHVACMPGHRSKHTHQHTQRRTARTHASMHEMHECMGAYVHGCASSLHACPDIGPITTTEICEHVGACPNTRSMPGHKPMHTHCHEIGPITSAGNLPAHRRWKSAEVHVRMCVCVCTRLRGHIACMPGHRPKHTHWHTHRRTALTHAAARPSTQAPEITCQHIGGSTSMAARASIDHAMCKDA